MRIVLRIVVAVLSILGIAALWGILRHRRQIDGEVRDLFARADGDAGPVVTEEDLRDLPEPVQRYLRYSGVVGRPVARTARLKQRGRIRQGEDSPWMAFTAREYYTVRPPAFVWEATTTISGLPVALVRDRYTDGRGHMLVRAAGLAPVVDAYGEEMDQGALMRYLNEMMWFPSAYLGENVSWQAIDDASAAVTLVDGQHRVTATMHFDAEGRVTTFDGRRNRTVPGGYELETGSTPITRYGEFGGLRLPSAGQGVWHLATGDLPYVEIEVLEVEQDRPEPY